MTLARAGTAGTLAALLAASSCDVPPPPAPTGGVDLPPTSCGRGLVVESSDYQSTNVSLTALDGQVLSESLLSSGAAPAGINAALSGDVALPSSTPTSGRVVLLDRGSSGVLTFLDPVTGNVEAQLPLGSGFGFNPHDYLEVDDTRAYVTRYETNFAAPADSLDRGGDVVILDTRRPALLGRIDLAPVTPSPYLPRADRMVRREGEVTLVLQLYAADRSFTTAGDARLVGVAIASDSVVWTYDLPGLKSCGGPVLSPSGGLLAVPCTGLFPCNPRRDPGCDASSASETTQLAASGVVLLDVTVSPPAELRRFAVAAELGAPVGPSLAFASDRLVLGTTYGNLDVQRADLGFSLDLSTGAVTVLARPTTAFVLGDVHCSPLCNQPCVLANAELGALLRFQPSADGGLAALSPLRVEMRLGLPPRYITGF